MRTAVNHALFNRFICEEQTQDHEQSYNAPGQLAIFAKTNQGVGLSDMPHIFPFVLPDHISPHLGLSTRNDLIHPQQVVQQKLGIEKLMSFDQPALDNLEARQGTER